MIAEAGGGNIAPPWFGPAMQAILAPAMAPINNRLDNMEIRQENSTSFFDTDGVRPPMVHPNPVPNESPSTIGELKTLTGHSLTQMENYYAMPHTGTISERRRRLSKHYGVRLVEQQQQIVAPM